MVGVEDFGFFLILKFFEDRVIQVVGQARQTLKLIITLHAALEEVVNGSP